MPNLRGLQVLETLDAHGPLTITEIARLIGQDKSWVSRIVAACEPDGWIVREHGRVALGPRSALLAYGSSAGALIRRAQPLVDALAGVTGLTAQAYGLVGRYATVLAAAGGGPPLSSGGVGMATSLVGTAAGKVIAAQLEPERLERLLPPEPYPDPITELLVNPGYVAFATGRVAPLKADDGNRSRVPSTRRELDEALADVRERGMALDDGNLHPQIACIAVPWPASGDVAALACMGSPAEITASAELARRVLDAAAAPAATREDIVSAAAGARHYSVAP